MPWSRAAHGCHPLGPRAGTFVLAPNRRGTLQLHEPQTRDQPHHNPPRSPAQRDAVLHAPRPPVRPPRPPVSDAPADRHEEKTLRPPRTRNGSRGPAGREGRGRGRRGRDGPAKNVQLPRRHPRLRPRPSRARGPPASRAELTSTKDKRMRKKCGAASDAARPRRAPARSLSARGASARSSEEPQPQAPTTRTFPAP